MTVVLAVGTGLEFVGYTCPRVQVIVPTAWHKSCSAGRALALYMALSFLRTRGWCRLWSQLSMAIIFLLYLTAPMAPFTGHGTASGMVVTIDHAD
jgi:hypothetical protein